MRTPEHRAHPRAGKNFEVDLDMNYLGPGAFTVLPLDPERLPDPPPAPPPYRLTPSTHRQKHKSFAIIGEPTTSNSNSRSSSPSGRVSPFKGHGFNPIGSRHASPSISPTPPDDPRAISPRPGAIVGTSRIPKPAAGNKTYRKPATAAVFGERVSHVNFRGLNRQSSQSLTSLEEKNVRRRPPPSPRKKLKGPLAFKELSPIQGSSPEPSQSLSSPSRIPTKSKSTPPSRLTSPTREQSRGPSRSQSRTNLSHSRDQSPVALPTKIPVKKYEHVQSRINSFNSKPKVPPKPTVPPTSSDLSEDSEFPKKKVLTRKNSFGRTSSRPNLLPKTFMSNKKPNYTSDSSLSAEPVDTRKPKTVSAKTFGPKVNTKNVPNSPSVAKNSSSVAKTNDSKPGASKISTPTSVNKKEPSTPSAQKSTPKENEVSTDVSQTGNSGKKSSIRGSKLDLTDLDLEENAIPSTMDVVSSTTTTVTKPLKIDTPKLGRTKAMSPIIDGRVLSATSVSQALNKMNDTVLNSQTLIKDSGLQSRLSSAAGAVVSVRSECNEKKGGIYENMDGTEKASPKNSEKVESKEDQNKKIDNASSNSTSEGVAATKTDGKTNIQSPTAARTVKVSPNNVNTNSSSTEPATKSTETQNNPKVASPFPNTINNSTNHVSNNHSNNHVTTVGLGNARAIEREVQNNMNKLLGSMDSSLGDTPINKLSANDRIREARTVIAADVKPIRILVREKPSDVEVQSGNVGPHFSISNGVNERPGLPPHQQTPPNEPAKEEPPPNRCKRFLNSCTKALTCNKCQSCKRVPKVQEVQEEIEKTGCFKCLSKKSTKKNTQEEVRINIEDENGQVKRSIWEKLKCCKRNRVGDTQSCFPIGKRKESWVERRAGSFLESEDQQKTKCCSKLGCKNFFRKFFCCCCKKKEEVPLPATRQGSMVSSKKKSLTPTTLPPPEDTRPKIDASLVEHNSHMKGAIPVLPVWLAWFCCVMNCIGPGTGTVFSGLFCLCLGKPRFSQTDGPKPRIGSFVINLIIGFSQFFTVLFCLVGWGWSIWWGVIMVKIAKKHRRFKHLEHLEETAARPQPLAGQSKIDADRGRT